MIPELHTALSARLAPLPVDLGPQALGEHASPPRIVLVPARDRFDPPGTLGPHLMDRALAARVAGVQCLLWGRDYAEAEELITSLLVALTETRGPVLAIESGEWVRGEWLTHGEAYRLTVTMTEPVLLPAAANPWARPGGDPPE